MTERDIEMLALKIAENLATPRWLKLSAAVKYSAYGRPTLIHLAKKRKIIGYQDPDSERGDWIFDKDSIDTYRLSHVANRRKKAVDIYNSL